MLASASWKDVPVRKRSAVKDDRHTQTNEGYEAGQTCPKCGDLVAWREYICPWCGCKLRP